MNDYDENIYLCVSNVREFFEDKNYYPDDLTIEVQKLDLFAELKEYFTPLLNNIFQFLSEEFPIQIYWKSEQNIHDSLEGGISNRLLKKKEMQEFESYCMDTHKDMFSDYHTVTCLLKRFLNMDVYHGLHKWNFHRDLLLFTPKMDLSLKDVSQELKFHAKRVIWTPSINYQKINTICQNNPEWLIIDYISYEDNLNLSLYGVKEGAISKVYNMLKSQPDLKIVSYEEYRQISNYWCSKRTTIDFNKEVTKNSEVLLDKSASLEERIYAAQELSFIEDIEDFYSGRYVDYDHPSIIKNLAKVAMSTGENVNLLLTCADSIVERWIITEKYDQELFEGLSVIIQKRILNHFFLRRLELPDWLSKKIIDMNDENKT